MLPDKGSNYQIFKNIVIKTVLYNLSLKMNVIMVRQVFIKGDYKTNDGTNIGGPEAIGT